MLFRSITPTSVAKVILGVAVAFGVVMVPQAHAAAVTCWGDYCSGQDPQATHCADDAYTVASAWDPNGAYLELRWSPTCRTNWARVNGAPQPDRWIKVVQPSTGYTQWGNLGNGVNTWSRQIYSPTRCVYAQYGGTFRTTLTTTCV